MLPSAGICPGQVRSLRPFYEGGLPFSGDHVRDIRSALEQAGGTVENAAGIHDLGVSSRDGLRLNAKTGATRMEDGTGVSWLVGRLTVEPSIRIRECGLAPAAQRRRHGGVAARDPDVRSPRAAHERPHLTSRHGVPRPS
ncbi:MAG: hypothetical protein GEU90_00865 [Gemmatimonas sp.]|nr:hypothetical protein [Gemmatimonas sp.]